MRTSLTKAKEGRPTKLTKELVAKLESIFKVGGTVEEASSYAGINKTTYYRWLKHNEDFATEMRAAQHYADIVAKNVIVASIVEDKNVGDAKWWLEKRQFKDKGIVIDQRKYYVELPARKQIINGEVVESTSEASVGTSQA